jgi:NifU-like protein involved in Fe-S cluster formation
MSAVFSDSIADHLRVPRNVGVVRRHNRCWLERNNPWRIRLLFTLEVDGDRIAMVKFQSQSCATTIACASAMTELARSKRVADAAAIAPADLAAALGGVPPEKMHCCTLVVETLRNALQLGRACNCGLREQSPTTNSSGKD